MRRDDPRRRFNRDFKLAAVRRMAAGANVSKLSRELGISRKGLYQWQKQFRMGGAAALRAVGRPRGGAATGEERKGGDALRSLSGDELSRALARIAELERLVGQQAADLDFFQQALQHVGKAPQSGAPGGTVSTRSSKR
ncbi:helix-turn-helix domain-containing protein [Mesorhizobium sp. M1C.F.Ca.ET.193.01.1.1]|uniref:transposase n=1 Tax=unclassified Mesorhizobium TaxID=325217 RepID=UPI000FD26227|nr:MULTISPECIES: transposase [unclassified Mesorhizobium]TGS90793.1 helix-turn-helix domain-containing protein [bacterium M00.F.Ca.ET.177.01.1.1]TGQ49591.1 helix-turn-helix domain-containing protein [Mesorhizobium sp. M1C.F.Ca.ET.210.01.1.1]TGQ63545.1 helix-turn-helix domain-containing protein [Mesorhizobium sp. M1C.F.Ca.ET.212.01.1.1]TGQ97294.1 helix-turn-helix domain-containing protein [Mesorhizobium sp. M1C.F.Ca.ET.204.01.1.1]TGR17412.1 helix-turn-helix domain-containing protein [Mesorhizob